jgi:predicted peptidase
MMRTQVFSVMAAVAVLMSAKTIPAAEEASGTRGTNQMAKQLHITRSTTVDLNYLLFLPGDYAKEEQKRWPLILFLHGSGERGSDVWKVATHGPPKNVAAHPEFPFIVVSPQCPAGQTWSHDTLDALLKEVMEKHRVDKSRVYLTGLSMGGYGTWSFGLAHPDKFAAIVPICGGGEMISVILSSREKGDALKSLGIWAFHGGKDPVVPVAESQRMVDAAKKAGVTDVKLTIHPKAGHDSWTQTYNNPELYEWMLSHRRAGAE